MTAEATTSPDGAGKLVLVLDDDLAVGRTIALGAERAGFEARVHQHAASFLAAVDAERPSHVIVDLVLPDVDGVEVLRRLALASCPAGVILTSGAGQRVLDAARRLGEEHGLSLRGVLPKPFRIETLHALLAAGGADAASRATPRLPPGADRGRRIGQGRLRAALDAGEVSVAFQPKIACATGHPVGFEALAQWHRPGGPPVPADHFVALAERSNLIGPLTEHVVTTALGWLASGVPETLSLAINFSPLSLDDSGMAAQLVARCADHGIAPDRLVLEMTESAAMRDPVATLGVLTQLRLRGFRVSIDDFGMGYSSIAQLARLPFSELKIDRSFVRSIASSAENRNIARAMVGLGHSLGLVVAAEGVEDAAALAFLADIGCDHAQGFFIAAPLDGAAALTWAERAVSRPHHAPG